MRCAQSHNVERLLDSNNAAREARSLGNGQSQIPFKASSDPGPQLSITLQRDCSGDFRNQPEPPPGELSPDPDDVIDPDDRVPRLSSTLLPSPLPAEMPADWWKALLFGKPDNVVGFEDARLALALIEARLAEGQDRGHSIKRDPGANAATVLTVGALHEWIYERYDSPGWFAFQQLAHEAMGLHPRRKKVDITDPAITNNKAKPLNLSDAIEPGLANALMQAPTRVQRWMLAPPYKPPRWRSSPPSAESDDGAWCGS
jgi:hypothetical protein